MQLNYTGKNHNIQCVTSPITFSFGLNKYDNTPIQIAVNSFDEFADYIKVNRSDVKGEGYFCSALEFGEHYNSAKFPNPNYYRIKELNLSRRFLPIDLDKIDKTVYPEILDWLGRNRSFGYLTASHTPEKPRARMVLELSRNVSRDESLLIGKLIEFLAFIQFCEEKLKFDDAVYRHEQPVYGPLKDAEVFEYLDSPVLEVDDFLKSYEYLLEQCDTESSKTANTITHLQGYAKLKPKSLSLVLSKIDFDDEPTWSAVASSLARVYGEEGRVYFDQFSSGSLAGGCSEKYDVEEVDTRFDRALSELNSRPNGYGIKHLCHLANLDPSGLDFDQSDFFLSPDTQEQESTFVFPVRNQKNRPLQVTENLDALLKYKGIQVRYNQISKRSEIIIPGMHSVIDEADNSALTRLTDEAVKAGMTAARIDEFASTIASENPYCPVQTYIDSKAWDGESRLDQFCAQIVTPKPKIAKILITKWLVQAVGAVYAQNGISAAGVLIFVGRQGVGKTRLLRDLTSGVRDTFLEGALLNPNDKDSVMTVCSRWLVELGELDATIRKADIAQLKAFLTKDSDTLRRPYARKDSKFQRRTVFAGTVNEFEFLQDATGNRRFWPIEVTEVKRDTSLDVQQLWSEIKCMYLEGYSWHLTSEELGKLDRHCRSFEVTDPIVERLLHNYKFDDCEEFKAVSINTILEDLYMHNPTKSEVQRLTTAIRKFNGNRKPKLVNGARHHWVPKRF